MAYVSGPKLPVRQPTNWRDASTKNVERLRQIFDLPKEPLTPVERRSYSRMGHLMAAQMMEGGEPKSKYWGIYINCVRVLVTADYPECDLDTAFE
jgi:hypothetical protein